MHCFKAAVQKKEKEKHKKGGKQNSTWYCRTSKNILDSKAEFIEYRIKANLISEVSR